MECAFEERFPLLEIRGGLIVSKQGAVTIGYEVTMPEIFAASVQDMDSMGQTWVKALGTLHAGTMLHKQDWFFKKGYVARRVGKDSGEVGEVLSADDKATNAEFFANASERHFQGRPRLVHRSYLYFSKVPDGYRPGASRLSSLLDQSLVPRETLNPVAIGLFRARVEQCVRILTDGGLSLRPVETDELVSSQEHTGLVEQAVTLQDADGPAVLRDIHFQPELRVGDRLCRIYQLSDTDLLPPDCSYSRVYHPYSTDLRPFYIGFASPVGLLLEEDHVYNQYIWIPDQLAARSTLERKTRRHRSMSAHSRYNAQAAQAGDDFLNEGMSGQRQIVMAHFNVMVWADDPAALKAISNRVSGAIARMGATPYIATSGAPHLYWSHIPGNAADLPPSELFYAFAAQAATFLIQESNYRSSSSAFGFRLGDRITGYPLRVDLSDEPMRQHLIHNRNKFVLGGSGSGKSFFINMLLLHYARSSAHIVVVDIGGSYKQLCAVLGGYYFTYSDKNPLCFNPFWLSGALQPGLEKKESIIAMLLAIWKKDDEPFLRSEYVALSYALKLYFEYLPLHPDLFPCFNTFYEFLQDVFAPMLTSDGVKEKDFDLANFLFVLRPFYRGGEYDYLLNATTELDLFHQPFIVFELDNIKDHPILFSIVTIIIMEVFIHKMRNLPGIRKGIIIEEAWKVIAKKVSGEFVKYLFKTIRKFFGEAIIVTQDMDDLISSPIVKQAIINNADCRILLGQYSAGEKFDQVMELLDLSDHDKSLVRSLNRSNEIGRNYKEVFVKLGSGHARVYRNEVSPEEHLLFTTEESERVQVNKYLAQQGNIRQAIAALVAAAKGGVGKGLVIAGILLLAVLLPGTPARAQLPIADIIKEGIKRVIVAADLEVQRWQTQSILLQDAQREVENVMEQLQLNEIAGWLQDQADLYGEYYQELWEVKSALLTYQRLKDLISQQASLVSRSKRAYRTFRKDPHFTAAELGQIELVFEGILAESVQTVDQIGYVIRSFATQMSDGQRLSIIDQAADGVDQSAMDLQRFCDENVLLSLQRAKDQGDLDLIKRLYGLQ